MSLILMGKKKGMTRIFDKEGNVVICTVIAVEPHVVTQIRTKEKEGYEAVQLASLKLAPSRAKNVSKALKGHFSKAKVEPRGALQESRLTETQAYTVGQEVGLDAIEGWQWVDVAGQSKGKGFQGVIKRYHFAGGPASHGSGFHRSMGSTGMRSSPGRGLPGKKMPGHMGAERVTTQSLRVVKLDKEQQVLLVEGSVPGARESLVYINKAKKKNKKVA